MHRLLTHALVLLGIGAAVWVGVRLQTAGATPAAAPDADGRLQTAAADYERLAERYNAEAGTVFSRLRGGGAADSEAARLLFAELLESEQRFASGLAALDVPGPAADERDELLDVERQIVAVLRRLAAETDRREAERRYADELRPLLEQAAEAAARLRSALGVPAASPAVN